MNVLSYSLIVDMFALQSLGVSRRAQTVSALFKAKAPAGPAYVCVDW